MGFGLCFVGFAALMLDSVGLDAFGYALIGAGFLKVWRELRDYKGYKAAGIFALAAAPVALLSLYSLLSVYTVLPSLPGAVLKLKTVYLSALGAAICIAHCQSTAGLAKSCGGRVFALRAQVTLYVSALYFSGNIAGALFGAPGGVAAVFIVGKYLVPLLNALLLFTCFTTITTKNRAAEELRIIKQQAELIQRKQLKKRGGDKEEGD